MGFRKGGPVALETISLFVGITERGSEIVDMTDDGLCHPSRRGRVSANEGGKSLCLELSLRPVLPSSLHLCPRALLQSARGGRKVGNLGVEVVVHPIGHGHEKVFLPPPHSCTVSGWSDLLFLPHVLLHLLSLLLSLPPSPRSPLLSSWSTGRSSSLPHSLPQTPTCSSLLSSLPLSSDLDLCVDHDLDVDLGVGHGKGGRGRKGRGRRGGKGQRRERRGRDHGWERDHRSG